MLQLVPVSVGSLIFILLLTGASLFTLLENPCELANGFSLGRFVTSY
jgi:hypothetical protein